MKKRTGGALLFFMLLFCLSFSLTGRAEKSWVQQEGHWYCYEEENGVRTPVNGWVLSNGRWYYCGQGEMLSGWIIWKGNWYYLNQDGGMAEKQWVGNFYVDESGAALKDTTVDNERLSHYGSKMKNGKPIEEINEKTARYIDILAEHPDAKIEFGAPGQVVMETNRSFPFILFKAMRLYDRETGTLLYEGDGCFYRNAVLERVTEKGVEKRNPLSFLENPYLQAERVSMDPAGLISYVRGVKS